MNRENARFYGPGMGFDSRGGGVEMEGLGKGGGDGEGKMRWVEEGKSRVVDVKVPRGVHLHGGWRGVR